MGDTGLEPMTSWLRAEERGSLLPHSWVERRIPTELARSRQVDPFRASHWGGLQEGSAMGSDCRARCERTIALPDVIHAQQEIRAAPW